MDDELVWVGDVNNINTEVVNLIAAEEGCIYRRRAIEALEKAGLKWRIVYTNADLAGISAALKENLGITVLAKHTVPNDLNWAKSTSQLPELGEVGISLIKQSEESHAVDKLAEFIQLRLK